MSDVLLFKITNPQRDYVPRSSSIQMEEFMKTHLYKDFLNELNLRIEDMRDFLETGPEEMYKETKGGIAAVRMVAGVFTDLLNRLNEDRRGEDE